MLLPRIPGSPSNCCDLEPISKFDFEDFASDPYVVQVYGTKGGVGLLATDPHVVQVKDVHVDLDNHWT